MPVAHTIGTEFKPGPRIPGDQRGHWDHWSHAACFCAVAADVRPMRRL